MGSKTLVLFNHENRSTMNTGTRAGSRSIVYTFERQGSAEFGLVFRVLHVFRRQEIDDPLFGRFQRSRRRDRDREKKQKNTILFIIYIMRAYIVRGTKRRTIENILNRIAIINSRRTPAASVFVPRRYVLLYRFRHVSKSVCTFKTHNR